MNNNPAISVVCPTYNSEDFIGDTLRSVFSQSYRPVEIVVVDDGSSDNTTTVVRTLADEFDEVEVILLTNSHRGPGAARNAGVRAASCTWIAFIDSDDLWNEKKLEYLAEEIKCNPDCNFFCHNEHEIDMLGNSRVILDYLAMYNSAVDIPGQLYKRNLFKIEYE